GELAFSPAKATVKGLSVKAGQSSFTLDAGIARPLALLAAPRPGGGFAVPPAQVDFVLASPYLDLAELLPATPRGPMLSNARGTGRVSIGRLKNQRLDVQHVVAKLTLEPGVVTASPFTMNAYGGGVNGEARIDMSDPAQPAVGIKA